MQAARPDDIAPAHVIMDVIVYHNKKIAPDLSAYGPADYAIPISEWLETSTPLRHLLVGMVMLHRKIQAQTENPPSLHKEVAMFHHHQACATRLLHDQVEACSKKPDSALFTLIIAFLSSSLQQSAYGACRNHLEAARTTLNVYGMRSLTSFDNFDLRVYMVVDILAMTTAPPALLSPVAIDHHLHYLDLIGKLPVDSWMTAIPIPDELLASLAVVNLRRGGMALIPRPLCGSHDIGTSTESIVAYIQAFSPVTWAMKIRSPSSNDQSAEWELLARCFQGASCLYALLSDDNPSVTGDDYAKLDKSRVFLYVALTTCIRKLYDREHTKANHHNFLLWPMLIAGVEAVARRDQSELEFLCRKLKAATISMGAMAMHEAAAFLENLKDTTWTDRMTFENLQLDWGTIFERGPMFIM